MGAATQPAGPQGGLMDFMLLSYHFPMLIASIESIPVRGLGLGEFSSLFSPSTWLHVLDAFISGGLLPSALYPLPSPCVCE